MQATLTESKEEGACTWSSEPSRGNREEAQAMIKTSAMNNGLERRDLEGEDLPVVTTHRLQDTDQAQCLEAAKQPKQ